MTSVSIGSITPDFILSFSITRKSEVMLPEWINNPARVDPSIYNKQVTQVEYSFRASDAEKFEADKILLGHSKVYLEDTINNIGGYVWMKSINAKYDSINWVKPWEVTVTLISDDLGQVICDVTFSSEFSSSGEEQIVNGSFEDGTTGWNTCPRINEYAHTGSWSIFTYELSSCKQTLATPVPVSIIDSFGFWYAGFGQLEGILYCKIYYSDDSTETLDNFGYPQSWTYYDILANLTSSSGKSISAIEFYSPAPADAHWIDDVSLITIDVDILNHGVIIVDSGSEHDLPFDEDLSIRTFHNSEYIPDGEGIFLYWESSSNITITDASANPAEFIINSGKTGWVKAHYLENSLMLGTPFFDFYVTVTRFAFLYAKTTEVDVNRFPYSYNKTTEVDTKRFSAFVDVTDVAETFTEYEYEDLLDLYWGVNGNTWVAQTFTPSTSHNLRYVVLNLSAPLGITGDAIITIKATDVDGKPTGSDLASGTVPASKLGIYGANFTIYLDKTVALTSGTKYAIVMHSSITATNAINIGIISTNGYSGGSGLRSTDGGSTWTIESPDITFEEWGYE